MYNRDAQDMAKTIWLNIAKEVKSQGLIIKSFCDQAEISESVYYKHIRGAKRNDVLPDTKMDEIDNICRVLNRPLSSFMN